MTENNININSQVKCPFFWKTYASFFFSGYSPFAPGTAGSFAAILPLIAIGYFFPNFNYSIWFIVATVFIILTGVKACFNGERIWGQDNGHIVIDEVAGIMVTVIFLKFSIVMFVLAFFAFRFFDIFKMPPASYFDKKVHNGWGVMFDDVFAGIYANISLQIVLLLAKHFNIGMKFL